MTRGGRVEDGQTAEAEIAVSAVAPQAFVVGTAPRGQCYEPPQLLLISTGIARAVEPELADEAAHARASALTRRGVVADRGGP
jgi:hypothetical protein